MDSFINLAKKGYEAYQENQGEGHHQQQQQHHDDDVQDRRHHEPQPDLDHDDVVKRASSHAGESASEDSSLFASALHHLNNNKSEHVHPVDEEHLKRAHTEAYEGGNAKGLDAGGMGAAAAMQALKMFTQKGGKGGGGTSELVSMAMGEATKLFDHSGGASSGGKQEVINSAAMTMMKLVVQSKLSGGGFMGGHNSGGLGSLMGMASKLL
ncbi:hypothetical protein BU17DRAFT_67544 [Hysterangium stoloniferum]|nr:hypothetical protein BU17DRAFT_67544 [Hysterangium stoloniferum]